MLSTGKINHCSHPGLISCNTSISILPFKKGRRSKRLYLDDCRHLKMESEEKRKNRILIKRVSECFLNGVSISQSYGPAQLLELFFIHCSTSLNS